MIGDLSFDFGSALPGLGGGDLSGLSDPFAVAGNTPLIGLGGGGWPGMVTRDTGSGSGFNWSNIGNAISAGKDLLGAGLNIKSQFDNAAYQRAQQDYYKNQQARQAAYDQAWMNYLQQRQAWESNLQGMFGDVMGQFQGQLGDFQSQMGNIVNQELGAAQPLLQQSQQMLEPAVQALAKGEVPPILQPVLDQVKQRARAALMQQYANAGIDVSSASADVTAQVDQQAQAMLLAQAQAMLTGGLQTGQQGIGALGAAGQAVSASMAPFLSELQLMMSALGNLTGGMPPSPTAPAPAAPTA